MLFNIGDVVTRNSYNNDVFFRITDIDNDIAILEGINYRLSADSKLTDLKKENIVNNDDNDLLNRFGDSKLNRDEYFYLPGKILHIDTEFQLTNTLANPYKIRKKAIFKNCKNHQKWQKNGNFYKMYYTQL